MNKPLINELEHVDTTKLADNWMEVARVIEQSMIQSGAVPGVDYTYLDLYKLAQPLVVEQVKDGIVSL